MGLLLRQDHGQEEAREERRKKRKKEGLKLEESELTQFPNGIVLKYLISLVF